MWRGRFPRETAITTEAVFIARLDRASAACRAAHDAGRRRKQRQARRRFNAALQQVSLAGFLTHLNRDAGDFKLTEDLAHWAESGVTTAPELARLLDAEHRRNLRKSAFDYDDFDEAQEWEDFDPEC